MVGYWKFNEGTGTNAYDSSGGGHTAVLSGAPASWVAEQIGYSLEHNGTSDYETITHFASLGSDVSRTINLWCKLPGDQPQASPFLLKKGTTFYIYGANNGNSGGLSFVIYDGITPAGANIPCTSVFDDTRHMLTMVIDREVQKVHVYLDAVLVASGDVSTVGDVSSTGNLILASFDGTGYWTKGHYLEIFIENRVLSQAEITAIYSNRKIGWGVPPWKQLSWGKLSWGSAKRY